MTGTRRQQSSTVDLDADLLRSSYKEMTNWHVIDGAPSCGKTTLIDQLAAEGLPTVAECAREFIEEEMSQGRTIDEIHEHGASLQPRLLDAKRRVEACLRPADLAFLDGGVPGSIAWYRLFGLNPNEALRHCFHYRYASVFVLDRLPLELDGVRFGDDFTGSLDEWIGSDYTALGYNVVRVPVMAPEDRLRYVLDRVPAHAD